MYFFYENNKYYRYIVDFLFVQFYILFEYI